MIFSYLSICLWKLFLPVQSKNGHATGGTEPLFEFIKDCEARDSIFNYKIQSATKTMDFTLNGPVQIIFDECSMSNALKLVKRCIRISPIYIRYRRSPHRASSHRTDFSIVRFFKNMNSPHRKVHPLYSTVLQLLIQEYKQLFQLIVIISSLLRNFMQ